MKTLFYFLGFCFFSSSLSFSQTGTSPRVDSAFEGRSLKNPTQRKKIVDDLARFQSERRKRAVAQAQRQKKPLRINLPNGGVKEVVDLSPIGDLVYLITHNNNARISTAVPSAFQNYGLDGEGMSVGVWDAGAVRATHSEFLTNRVIVQDGGSVNDHATHVAGTIAARGANPNAKGMAPNATIQSFNWSSDLAEMADNAALTATETNKIRVSNHSYGFARGWSRSGSRWVWGGFFGNDVDSVDYYFGYYSSSARSVDSIAYDAPYYLIFWSAGNDRGENPTTGSAITIGGVNTTYNPAIHPAGDGVYMGGYELIADHAVAKNIVTVGAVSDAVLSGNRDISRASMSSFSCWGPTDDGRVKPDLVGNGVSVYSSVASGDNSYATYSGTSMASPNVAGSAVLLSQHYFELSGGEHMCSSSLKGLLIHTADDLDSTGPDYKTGWGLVNTDSGANHLTDHFQNPNKKSFNEGQLDNSNSSRTYKILSDGNSPLKITLSWTDPVGQEIIYADDITPVLVNDLNLKVIAPDGTIFYPYVMPFTTLWTQASMSLPATTGVNDRDNVEQVFIESPTQAGVYTVVVDHVGSITNAQQKYSLFISGSSGATPVISEIMDQTTPEDVPLENLAFTVTHSILDNTNILVTATSSNPQLVPNENINITNNGINYLLNAQPTPDQEGQTLITIRVFDGINTVEKTFSYYVFAINDPPELGGLNNLTLYKNQISQPISLDVIDKDTPINNLNFSFSSTNESLLPQENIEFSYSIEGGWTFTVNPQQDIVGNALVTIFVSDLDNSISQSFNLNVIQAMSTFSQWALENGLDTGSPSIHSSDEDGDGLVNILEYFAGLDPNLKDNYETFWQTTDGVNALFYYRRSKQTIGINGEVKWTTNLSSNLWSSDGILDWLVNETQDYQLRCAQLPLPEGNAPLFMKVDITLE